MGLQWAHVQLLELDCGAYVGELPCLVPSAHAMELCLASLLFAGSWCLSAAPVVPVLGSVLPGGLSLCTVRTGSGDR